MKQRKVTKVITFYDDGSFDEIHQIQDPITQQPFPKLYPDYIPKDPQCSSCGLSLKGVMGYCCPQPYCPCGLGGVQSVSNPSVNSGGISTTSAPLSPNVNVTYYSGAGTNEWELK